jgi:catalase
MLAVQVYFLRSLKHTNADLGLGAHGTFTSYGDYSNITAASFLAKEGKTTPVFVRFSTVAGSRGSADTARDVHGFATRFYTDEGNFGLFYQRDLNE